MSKAGWQDQLREEGACVLPGMLSAEALDRARNVLDRAFADQERRTGSSHDPRLDPNAANRRLYNLPALDPLFIDLLLHEKALEAARTACNGNVLVSNFTANDALPGSGSMRLHSDQALVVPAPWLHCWAVNVIWCLDDVDEENGATRYLPGSHRFRDHTDVPADAMERTVAFSAPAGSFVVMEGRLWHTSGANVSRDRRRRMLFAYYSSDFIRQQANWNRALPQAVQDGLSAEGRDLFGLGPAGNIRLGSALTRLNEPAA